MVKQTGTGETATRSSSTRPASCADCARQGCPSLGFFGSSPKTGIATWFSKESRDARCSPQNECNRQDHPGAGPRKFSNNSSRCFPGCMRPAGPGAIASRCTFFFIAEQCDSSISREHAASVKPGYRRGVRRTTPHRRLGENSPGVLEQSKMTTRLASLPSNFCPENSRPRRLITGRHSTGAPIVRSSSARKLIDCSGRRFRDSV